jgi:DMSO reductase anchor subunit
MTYVPSGLCAVGWVFLQRNDGVFAALGIAGAVMCLLTVYCTAMIYASLKSIQRWSNRLVPPVYMALSAATGGLLLALLADLFGYGGLPVDLTALAAVTVAMVLKLAYWDMIRRTDGESTVASATGLGKPGLVRLLDAPHTESNYLLQEMGYRIARKHANRLRRIAGLLLFAAPLALLAAALLTGARPETTLLMVLAVASASGGVLVERWLFFAEARHTVTLYYGFERA